MFGHQGMAQLGGVILLECEWSRRKCAIRDRLGGFKTPGQTQVCCFWIWMENAKPPCLPVCHYKDNGLKF